MIQHASAPALVRLPALAFRGCAGRRRHVLSILDLSPDEVLYLAPARGADQARPPRSRRRCAGRRWECTSARPPPAPAPATVGAGRLGATVVTFGPADLQTNTGETPGDTARTLAGFLDVLVMRTNEGVDEMQAFVAHPSMSVVNALSQDEHPTQALADLATLLEHVWRLEGISLLYCGEGNRTAAALVLAMARIPGTRLVLATPAGYGLDPRKLAAARSLAAGHGASIEETHDLEGVEPGFDVVCTSRWQEMGVGKPDPEWKARFAPLPA
jgi:ornithine carbamoyltransferase